MMELWVRDSFGKKRDVILGYDDPVSYFPSPASEDFADGSHSDEDTDGP